MVKIKKNHTDEDELREQVLFRILDREGKALLINHIVEKNIIVVLHTI